MHEAPPALLNWLSAEALTDHVELVEARIGQADRPAGPGMADLDLEPQHVAQLAFERGKIGVDLAALALDPSANVAPSTGADVLGELLGLADATPASDDLLGQALGYIRAGGVDRRARGVAADPGAARPRWL